MLERKHIVQKSFRIDRKLDIALAELSEILNRSQNELIDHAIRLLIRENKKWFSDKFVNEYFEKIVPNLYEPYCEIINNTQLIFQPYDFSKGEGAFLILNEIGEDGTMKEIYRCNVHNYPGTHSEIANALAEVGKILGKKYPGLQKKYGIIDIDV